MIGWLVELGTAWFVFHVALIGLAWAGLFLVETMGVRRALRTTRCFAGLFVLAPCLLVGMRLVLEPIGATESAGAWGAVVGFLPLAAEAHELSSVSHLEGSPELEGSTAFPWRAFLLGIWFIGSVVALLRLAWCGVSLVRHLRGLGPTEACLADAVRSHLPPGAKVRIREDAGAQGPYSSRLLGAWLVFPKSAKGGNALFAPCVVRHEWAHLRYGDSWDVLFWSVVRAIYWWHPLGHGVCRRLEEVQEWRADADAVREEPEEALQLSRVLLAHAGKGSPWVGVGAQGVAVRSGQPLERRVRRLLKMSVEKSGGQVKTWLVHGLLILTALVSLGAASLLVAEEKKGDTERSRDLAAGVDATQLTLEDRVARVQGGADTEDLVSVEMKIFEIVKAAKGVKALKAPKTKILAPDDVADLVAKFAKDRDVTVVSYPRVLTKNGHVATIRSVINEPVGLSVNPNTQEEEIEYLPVGTVIGLAPVILESGMIHCELSMTFSDIIGERVIGGRRFPIASSRVFSGPLVVAAGQTVCLEGLEAPPGDGADRQLVLLVTPTRMPKEAVPEVEK